MIISSVDLILAACFLSLFPEFENVLVKSVGDTWFVHCIEVVNTSESPLLN